MRFGEPGERSKHCCRRRSAAACRGRLCDLPVHRLSSGRRGLVACCPSRGSLCAQTHAFARATPDATGQMRGHRTNGGNRIPLRSAATRYPAAPAGFARITGANILLGCHPSPGPVYAHRPTSPMPSDNPTIRANRGTEPPFLAAHPSPQPFMRINLPAKWLTRIFGTTISLKYKYRAVEFQRPKTGVKIGRGNHCSHSTKRRCREEHDCHASRRGIP